MEEKDICYECGKEVEYSESVDCLDCGKIVCLDCDDYIRKNNGDTFCQECASSNTKEA